MGRFIDADGRQYYFEPGKGGSLTTPDTRKRAEIPESKPVSKVVMPKLDTPSLCPNCGTLNKAKVIFGTPK